MLVKYTVEMSKVYTIYEAKTQLSKLGKRAAAGETIYVGAYGDPAFIIAPISRTQNRQLGTWNGRKHIDYTVLEESDADISLWLEGNDE